MWINRWIEKVGIPKLSLVITGYVCVSLLIAVASYYVLEVSLYSLTTKVVSQSSSYEEEVDRLYQGIQRYINKQQLSLDEAWRLEFWHQKHEEFLVYIFDDQDVYYDSNYTSYWYLESDIMDIPRIYSVTFADGTAMLEIYPLFNLGFILWGRVLCAIASMIIFMITFLTFLHRQMAYILEISHAVERMKNGELSTSIPIRGNDEVSQLADNINEMAVTLKYQIEVEKQLKEQNMKMVTSLSHDLRTPLTSVISYLDIIQQGKDQGEKSKYLDIVYSKAIQIKYLIDQLFHQCVKEESKGMDLTTYADELIEQCLHETVHLLEDEGFCVDVNVDILDSFSLQMECRDLNRIMDNICSNLTKYADKSFVVEFCVQQLEENLLILVKNQVVRVERLAVESHGVGLLSCRTLIEEMGGKLEIIQEHNQFIFKCQLPILQNY